MATRLRFTGEAAAPVTYQNKYTVETGAVIEVDDQDIDALLATGAFEKVSTSKSGSDNGKNTKDNQKSKS